MSDTLPKAGTSPDQVLARMRELKKGDADWRAGRTWSLVYPAGEDVDDVLREANLLYLYENALNPFRFPSLRQLEVEVVKMTASLLHGDDGADGAMTSGGTESILMAVKSARDRARAERDVSANRGCCLPRYSAHPAFGKGRNQIFGLEARADSAAQTTTAPTRMPRRGFIDRADTLLVGRLGALNYPFGVVDPDPGAGCTRAVNGASPSTPTRVSGGFMLPFFERIGEPVFHPSTSGCPGVTTISADVHKYGYATKGASVIAHRERRTLHEYQLFKYRDWPGGGYASFAMAGARPAAPIAAAWAVMNYLGEDGYLRLARQTLDTTRALRDGIEAIPGLEVWAEPAMTLFSFGSKVVDIFGIGDAMDQRGWCLDRQNDPDALHLMVSPEHARIVDDFLTDLREAVRHHDPSRGKEARYS